MLATTVVAAEFQRQTKHKKLSLKEQVFDIRRFFTWIKLILTLTTVMSFISKLQIRILQKKPIKTHPPVMKMNKFYVKPHMLKKPSLTQSKFFKLNRFLILSKKLENKSKIDNKDKLVQLNSFLDQKTVLRARGRLEFASCMKEDARSPII